MTDRPPLSSILKTFNPTLLPLLFLFALLFAFLSYTEFTTNHTSLITAPPSPLITIINPSPNSATFTPQVTWRISAPSIPETVTTSIYYGQVSTPSALSNLVSPEEVIYPSHTSDYLLGSFPLPATFIARLNLAPRSTYYYRAYTFINKQHLWTPEFTLTTD